jgi:hypothetical protein
MGASNGPLHSAVGITIVLSRCGDIKTIGSFQNGLYSMMYFLVSPET